MSIKYCMVRFSSSPGQRVLKHLYTVNYQWPKKQLPVLSSDCPGYGGHRLGCTLHPAAFIVIPWIRTWSIRVAGISSEIIVHALPPLPLLPPRPPPLTCTLPPPPLRFFSIVGINIQLTCSCRALWTGLYYSQLVHRYRTVDETLHHNSWAETSTILPGSCLQSPRMGSNYGCVVINTTRTFDH